MKKKSKIYSILLCVILLITNITFAQDNSIEDKQNVKIIKEFYTAYITEVAESADPKKLSILQKKYCTVSFPDFRAIQK